MKIFIITLSTDSKQDWLSLTAISHFYSGLRWRCHTYVTKLMIKERFVYVSSELLEGRGLW